MVAHKRRMVTRDFVAAVKQRLPFQSKEEIASTLNVTRDVVIEIFQGVHHTQREQLERCPGCGGKRLPSSEACRVCRDRSAS